MEVGELNTCSKCQSDKVIPDVRIIDHVGHRISLGVNVYEHPEALIFKGTHSGTLRSQVCGECGYVEIYVENPRELYTVYTESQGE
jgi:hypothetical protein